MIEKVLALIPAYNEGARVATVVTGTLAHLPVLVIDDGSQDDTAALAEAAGARVLRQQPNQGKGAALLAGFSRAAKDGYEAVITLDADGQHDPVEIPNFLKRHHATQADLIIGARDFSQMPLVRRLANTLGTWAFSWALGYYVLDNQSGYRLLSHRMMTAMLDSHERGFEFEVEMILICIQKNFILDWVPIQTIYAGEASHINNRQHVINFLRVVWQTRQAVRRAR